MKATRTTIHDHPGGVALAPLPSRAHQIHTSAMRKLRAALQEMTRDQQAPRRCCGVGGER